MSEVSMYCEHHRTVGACEECAYAASAAAGRPMEGLFRDTASEAAADAAVQPALPPPAEAPLQQAEAPR